MTKIVEHLSALLGACSRVVEAATKTNYSQLPAFLRAEIENLKITSKAVEEETGVTSNYLPANEPSFAIRDEPSPVRGNPTMSGALEVIRRKKCLLLTREKELSNLTFGRVVNGSLELYENETVQKAALVVDLKGTAIATVRRKKKGEREKVGFLMVEPGSDTSYTMYCFPAEVYNWITSMTIAGGFEVEAESLEHAMNANGKNKRHSLTNRVPSQESASNAPSTPTKEAMPVFADHRRTLLPPPPAHSTPKESPTHVDLHRLPPMLPPNPPFAKINPTINDAQHPDGGQIRGLPGFKPWNKPTVEPGNGGRSQDSGNAGTPSRPAMAMAPNRYPLITQQPVIPFAKVAEVEPVDEFDDDGIYTDFGPTEDFEHGKPTTMTGHETDSFDDVADEDAEDIYADVEAYEVDPPVQQPPPTAAVRNYPPLQASNSFDADEYCEVVLQEDKRDLQEETKSYHQQKLPEQTTKAPNASRGTPGWKPFQDEISPRGPGSHFAQLKTTGGGTGHNEGNNGRSLGQNPGSWTKFRNPDDVEEAQAPGGNGHLNKRNPELPERKSSLKSSAPPKGVNFSAQQQRPGQNVEDNRRAPLGQGNAPMVAPKGRIDGIARKFEAADSDDLSTSRNEEQRKPSVPEKSMNFPAIQSALHGKLKPFQPPVPASKPTLGQARPEVPPAIPPHVRSANAGNQAPNPYSRPSNKPVPKEFFGGRQLPPPPPRR